MERRLAAIVAADVVGYSRLMGLDETATLAALKAHRKELIDERIAANAGRIVKLMGDGILAEFPSVVNAVACAAEIQRGMFHRNASVPEDRRIELRIGVNLGDIIIEDGDIFGDGVNVASRLEAISAPGGIAISSTVRDHLGDRLDLAFEDLGEQLLKNIARPVRVFHVALHGRARTPADRPRPPLALPSKPSIAVLPFTNMSGDPEQEYFADGLVEDLITNLSKNSGLFVIARNSTFAYKGKAVDIRTVARELGVRYVLEGSVRRSASRLRITGQLIEGAAGTHVWADKFEGALEDIFDLQDRLTESIAGAIEPSLRRAEIDRARRKRPDSLDAYDLYLQALPHAYANTPVDTDEALRLLRESLRLDPNQAVAHAYAAWCLEQRYFRGGFHQEDKEAALDHARTSLASDDPQALSIAAFARYHLTHDYESTDAALTRSLAMNGNSALAFGFSALVNVSVDPERAIEHAQKALRLSPFDPLNYHPYCGLGLAYLFTSRAEESLGYLNLAIQSNPSFFLLYAFLAASLVELGRLDAAQAAIKRLLEASPGFTVGDFARMDLWRPGVMEALAAALSKAGLPA